MKIKSFLLAAAAVVCFAPISAQNNLKVVLKDGSELVGYISRQRPGQDFTFTTSKATVILPAEKVKSIVEHDVPYSELTNEWQDWSKSNDATVGKKRTLTLYDLITDKGTISRVRILERGSKIKYLELTPNAYSLNWDKLEVVRCDRRNKLLLSGINRKYKLKSGMEYEGQYVEEKPGESLNLYCTNGVVEVINAADIVKDSRVKVNPNQTLAEQSDLIDIIRLKNDSLYRGIIIERNYYDNESTARNSSRQDFLLIQRGNDITTVPLADIVEYRKEPNPEYKPQIDILLQPGDFAVNRINAWAQYAQEVNDIIKINTDSIVEIEQSGRKTPITIEANFDDASNGQQYKLLKAHKYIDKRNQPYYYAFTYEDMVKTSLTPKTSETSVNGTTKLEFDIIAPGVYVFFDPATKKHVVFKVS